MSLATSPGPPDHVSHHHPTSPSTALPPPPPKHPLQTPLLLPPLRLPPLIPPPSLPLLPLHLSPPRPTPPNPIRCRSNQFDSPSHFLVYRHGTGQDSSSKTTPSLARENDAVGILHSTTPMVGQDFPWKTSHFLTDKNDVVGFPPGIFHGDFSHSRLLAIGRKIYVIGRTTMFEWTGNVAVKLPIFLEEKIHCDGGRREDFMWPAAPPACCWWRSTIWILIQGQVGGEQERKKFGISKYGFC
ncbi:hypothetical protein RHMOL_Rhmol02G0127900 [Rhododendron molle]|uniref:Uncharacterized protein n=1 Tax=Rhododendron molle TaxID=49168 RepID=A0ACC0PPU1_RHOML|nr:hypothetical protein RHMOL_Rhmol02G0127900 [Rhododendron molle]